MSTTIIDERVVEMRFNNADFEKNVAQSMTTLGKLKDALNFDSAKSLTELSKASSNVSMSGLGEAVETVQAKFSALQVIGVTALAELTKAAISTGASMLKSLVSPITEGGMKRALNIEQAKFQLKGLGVAWEAVGDDINYAVDGTAYGLDVAAKAAAQLSASNVALGDDMKAALRGISGVAAMTGASYEEISRIFTTVAGNGRAMNGELNRIGERGLNASAAIAKYFNGVNDGTIEASESVKASVKSITEGLRVTEADIKEFAKDGQINFELFSYAMDTAFGEHAKDANSTFTGALSNMKAALSRIGADFATPYLESMKNVYNSARLVFNGIRTALKPVVSDYEYLIKIVEKGITSILDNKDFNTGLAHIIEALRYAFWDLMLVLRPIKDAFAEIFPGDLFSNFEKFTKKLSDVIAYFHITNKDANNLRDTFKGIFSIFKTVGTIVISVIKALATALFPAIKTSEGFLSTILAITGALGRFITYISKVILESNALQTVIQGIGKILASVIKIASVPILLVFNVIVKLIEYADKLIAKVKDFLEQTKLLERVGNTLARIGKMIGEVFKVIAGSIITGIIVAIYTLVTGVINLVNRFKDLIKNSQTIQNIFASLKEKILNIKDAIGGLLSYLKELASNSPVIQTILDNLSKLNKQTSDTMSMAERVGAVFKTLGTIIATVGLVIIAVLAKALEAVISFVSKVVEEFKNLGGKTNSLVGNIVRVFQAIGTTIGNFVKNSGLTDFLKGFKKENADSLSFLERFKTALHDFFEEFSLGHAIALAFVAVMAAVGIAFIKMSKQIGSAISNIGGLFGDIRNKLFGKKESFIDNFTKLAIAIGIVAGSLALLASVNQNNLNHAVVLISALIGGLTILTGIMTAVSIILQKKGLSVNMLRYAKSVLVMSAAVGILAASLYALQGVDIEGDKLNQMLIKIGMVLGTMLGLVGIITLLSKAAPGFTKGSLSIVTASLALILVAEALKKLEGIKIDNVAEGLLAVIPMFISLGAIMKMGESFDISAGAGLLLACIGINKLLPTLVKTMKDLAEADLSGLKSKILNNKAMVLIGVAALGGILLALGKAAPAFQAVGKILLSMAILSISLAASLAIVSKVFKDLTVFFEDMNRDASAWKKATIAMTAMISVLGLFSILFAVFAKLNIEKAVSKLLSFSVFMISFSASLVILTKVLKEVADLDEGQIRKGIGVITALAIIVDTMVYFAGKADKVNTKSLVALVLAITVLMGELIVLSVIPYQKLLAAMASMTGVMLGFAALLDVVSKMNTEHTIKKIATLLIAVGSMVVLSEGLARLAKNDWKSIAASGGAILAAMLGIKIVLDACESIRVNKNTLKALGIIIADLVAVGAALYFVSKNDWTSIAAAGGAMFAAMASIGVVIRLISDLRVNKSALAAFAIAIGDVLAIGIALALVAQNDWKSILAAGGMMTVALLAVAGAIAIVSSIGGMNSIAAAASIVAVSASLVILAAALKMFEQIDSEALKKAGISFGVLVGVLAILAGISAVTGGVFGVALLGVAAAMVLVGVAAVTFAAGVTLAAVGMNLMVPALEAMQQMDLEKIGQGLLTLGASLYVVGTAGVVSAAGGAAMLITAAGVLALGVALAFSGSYFEKFQTMDFTKVGTSLLVLSAAGLALIPASVGFTLAGAALLVLSAGLVTAGVSLSVFNAAIKTFLSVLNSAGGTARKAANNIVTSITKPLQDLITKVKKFVTDFKTALSTGWSSSEKEASNGGTKIAKALIAPFHAVLGWHSPPKFILDLFNDMSSAISSGGTKAEGSASSVGTGIANSLKSSILSGLNGFSLDGIFANLLSGLNIQLDVTSLSLNSATAYKNKYNKATKENIKYSKEEARAQELFADAEEAAANEAAKEANAIDSVTTSLGGAGKATKETKTAFETLKETISGQIDMFEKFELKTEISAEQMLENMKSNLDGVRQWSVEMASLQARGIDEALYQKLMEMGPQAYEKVHAFCSMTDEQLQQANNMWQESMTLPDEAGAVVAAGFDKTGTEAVAGFIKAINGGDKQAYGALVEFAQSGIKALNDTYQTHSPSRVTQDIGKNVGEGLNLGMQSMAAYCKSTAAAIAKAVVDRMQQGLAPGFFRNIGINAMNGLVNGLNAMQSSVYSAGYSIGEYTMKGMEQGLADNEHRPLEKARNIAQSITETINKALKVQSPSKVMIEIGRYVSEGLAIGMEEKAYQVYNSAEHVATVAEEGIETTAGRLEDFLADSFDFTPVITPVLDLSYIREQMASVNEIFGERGVNGNLQNGGTFTGNPEPTTISFTQNNYSPKELSRYDIYRNTRNQISMMKGVMKANA